MGPSRAGRVELATGREARLSVDAVVRGVDDLAGVPHDRRVEARVEPVRLTEERERDEQKGFVGDYG